MSSPHFIIPAMRRTMLALGCALALGACTSWREAPPPGPSPRNEISGPIRVVRPDGFSVVLRDAYVKGDTLYGYSAGTRMAVALRGVKAIQRDKDELLRTLGVVVGVAVVAVAAFVVSTFQTTGWSGS